MENKEVFRAGDEVEWMSSGLPLRLRSIYPRYYHRGRLSRVGQTTSEVICKEGKRVVKDRRYHPYNSWLNHVTPQPEGLEG